LVVAGSVCEKLAAHWGVAKLITNSAEEAQELRLSEDVILLDDWPVGGLKSASTGVFTLLDLLPQIRLTKFQCQIGISGDRLHLIFSQPEVLSILSLPHEGFQILCSPYSEE
jgi:hypothetical protein